MSLTTGDYLAGAALFLPMLALCAAAAWLVARRRLPGAGLVEQGLAWFAFTSTAVLLAHLLPGALGVLTRWAPLVAAALLLGAAGRVPAAAGDTPAARAEPDAQPTWSWGLAAAGVAAAVAGALAYLLERSTHVIDAIDSMTFHLPAVARWIQNESIWGLHQFSPDFSNATYPQNGLVMQLAAVLPWHDAFLVRYVNVAFVVALGVAVYALARELRAPASTAALAGAAATVLPSVAYPALEQAQVDAPGLAWLAIGVLFLARWMRTRDPLELLPAGIGLGLAFGTKWYHVVFVPLLLALCFGAAFWRSREWRPLVRPLAVLAGWIAAVGGFWLVRNAVETGNPVYPAKAVVFDVPRSRLDEIAGFRVWDYLTDWAIWQDWFLPAYKTQFGYLAVLLAGMLVVAAVLAWRARDRPVLLAVLATAALAVFYTRLPWTAYGPPGQPYLVGANARYAVPAVLGALVLTAWIAGRAGRLRPLLEAALLLGLADCLRRAYEGVDAGDVMRAVLLLAAAGAAIAAAAVMSSRSRSRLTAAGIAATVLLAFLAAGEGLRRRAHADSYASRDPVFAFIADRAPEGSRIGLAGLWSLAGVSPAFPAFGPALENDVEFVGPFVKHTLRNYSDRSSYQDAVRRGGYDLIVLGLGFQRELPPEQVRRVGWTRELGYREVARSNRLVLLSSPR